jgi:hypothetical protein
MDSDDNPEVAPSDHDVQAEDEDLRESLARLSRLASYRLPLEAMLTQVATYAVQAIPGADRWCRPDAA